ncbi:MAG: hypothetical protein JRI68_02175 [Deltaproteobacteria bacterium]|nr:hypothetical protein [Deltaproteobacteria bacterium]
MVIPDCYPVEGPGVPDTDSWSDAPHEATVTIDDVDTCSRTYHLTTSAPLLDSLPSTRSFGEQTDWPVLRSGHDLFDALYAQALEEVRENSVDTIVDGAFNGGQPIACPPGGCFETGRKWKYVWTRDTAYAVLLGLGALDPTRARNSLEFKTSERRGGGDRQIVQDTGTGGSYPISSDRVVWAMGAWELLKFLDGAERSAFLDLAYEAMANTAEHDRLVVYDSADGLYRGEQSFLDWREQSYPAWVATDTVQIGMSKALSTNVGHYQLLWVAAQLAAEKGQTAESTKYQGWADDLRSAITGHFYLSGPGLFSTFSTTFLDESPTEQHDLLGSSLAVLFDVGSAQQRASVVASYPHLPKGAPVMWPQQKDVPIYHNRGIWPFVTALWARAARQTENAGAVTRATHSLIRGAALNLSNMENFEAVTGAAYLDDGPSSGPVVNSQRQLWSVAGYVSLVHDVIFGMEASQEGIRFLPFIPRELRNTLFAGANRIALSRIPYRGRRIWVLVDLGDSDQAMDGALAATSVRLNGAEVGLDFIAATELGDDNLIEVTLGPASGATDTIAELSEAETVDYRNLFGPYTPQITGVGIQNDRIVIDFNAQGETPAEIEFDVYRDGQLVASALPGTTTSWTDTGSADHATHSYCYSVQSRFVGSQNASQHAKPFCYWGPGYNRIQTVGAQSFTSNGGTLVYQYNQWHYQGWGDPGHTLTVTGFTPTFTGTHYVQLLAGNGAGPYSTGITCGVKLVEVLDGNTVIASGYLMMPHLATWNDWRESSFLRVSLDANKSYTFVVREDGHAINMSELDHFSIYGGTGGATRFNHANIAELKVLAVDIQ